MAGLVTGFHDCIVLQKPCGAAEFDQVLQSLPHDARG